MRTSRLIVELSLSLRMRRTFRGPSASTVKSYFGDPQSCRCHPSGTPAAPTVWRDQSSTRSTGGSAGAVVVDATTIRSTATSVRLGTGAALERAGVAPLIGDPGAPRQAC